jgi:glyoxylase I family protein
MGIDFGQLLRCIRLSKEETMKNGSNEKAPAPAPVLGLHHYAYRCRDAEETRQFYEDVLGLPLVHVVKEAFVPSTGEKTPFAHVFFELKDGSCIAFFDLGDNVKPEPSPNTPPWVNHLALKVPSVKDVEIMKARLEAHGVNVLGITDHGFVKSIYFFDPNGIRLEFTAETATQDEIKEYARTAHSALAAWNQEKASARGAAKA